MAEHSINVLLVEDSPADVRLLLEFLKEVPTNPFQVTQCDRLETALNNLTESRFDIILLDLTLPDSMGLETLVNIHRRVPAIPVVILTGLDDEVITLRAMQEGAQDYLVKGQVTGDLLARSMRYAIERQRAEQKIRQQAALLDITTDAILVRDLSHRIVYWNKGAERLFGWHAEEAIGKNANQLLYRKSSPQLREALDVVIAKGEWLGELHKITKSDQEVTVESRWTLVRDEAGQPKSILTVDTNITEKKLLEAQFFRAQRLESIGTLASGISHDLNNILTPILAAAQLLPLKLKNLDDRSQLLLQLLETNARRGADLVKQVLSFTRGVEGKRVLLQTRHLISEIERILRETLPRSIEVEIEVPQDLWTIVGDSTQIHQVLMNLCVNARDAMPIGGVLTISATNQWLTETDKRLNIEAQIGPYCVLSVVDTGTGIAAEILDRIFEPFFTTKELGGGTGLGLSTVVGIVKSHGGFITVASQLGQGTEFKVFFPAVMIQESAPIEDPELHQGNDHLILVVDDEAPVRESTRITLEDYNYRVLTACDGVEAIETYSKHHDEIHLVLIDLMMPLMDGPTTILTLQRINPHVEIVAMSGLSSRGMVANAANAGVQRFLSKPFTVKDLLNTLEEALVEKVNT
ncbi:PAS domain S-box protein [Phormidesmis priestleyi ULC007]|uniref:histidine kinase n=1 Tax=Phormidesmis priestleyi ULC007 TaxID=1920490 RepID=A0A2T1D849_9CYAN|nr:hybrid sensor histidine kinase/response regulator [Phormidesmis priestleyi]PSB16614.1 PAS domain S-box protein [Phormidesmis priestleyi ULC007]PZO47518.1 MAG: PAS domain S-box protein [Phormidesmis priestleyi]